MAEVTLRELVKVYGSQLAVRSIDLDIPDGKFVVLAGPSGCGKSTTLRMVAGLETISHRELRIDGKLASALDPQDRGVAMVVQSYALYPHMTVRENLAFSLLIAKLSPGEIKARTGRAVEAMELIPYLERRSSELPGDQRQRVAMGGPSCASRRCFCSTSRCPTWMPSCATRCGSGSSGCSGC